MGPTPAVRRPMLRIAAVAKERGVPNIVRLQLLTGIAYTTLHALWNDPFVAPTDRTDVYLSTLARIAEALGVPVGALLEEAAHGR